MNYKCIAVIVLSLALSGNTLASQRQRQVRQNSMQVMPFSMDATMHMFQPNADGGVMTVMVRKPNAKQLTLIRSHLRREARAFAGGNYGDPASIHGNAMPGLAKLHSGWRLVAVRYADIPGGATITFKSSRAPVVSRFTNGSQRKSWITAPMQ